MTARALVLVSSLALLVAALPACGGDDAPRPEGVASNPGEPLVVDSALVCVPDCAGKLCGFDGCFGQCGVCGVGQTCEAGQCVGWTCQPDCEGRVCGPDGCGGDCGTCPEGAHCLNASGQCKVDPCQGIPYEGCCDGVVLTWCSSGELVTVDCADAPYCGWTGIEYDCGTAGASDPSGKFPRSCDGECSCDGKTCGDDGCGSSCGTCPDGEACNPDTGACESDPCLGIPYEGCCDGQVLTWCDAGELATIDCGDNPLCGWSEESGFFDCATDGGDDPSGTFSLDCGLGGEDCTPDCSGVDCGPDGCGGSCGTCDDGLACVAGACLEAEDACQGIPFEGCCDGDMLTWCEDAELLTLECDAGTCGWSDGDGFYNCDVDPLPDPSGEFPMTCFEDDEPECVPDCSEKECGGDGCGDSCGSCGDGASCEQGTCVPDCTPDCTNKDCGDDGCGGSCGACPSGATCEEPAGMCVSTDPCKGVTYEGCCDGEVLTWCEEGELWTNDCDVEGPSCGWSAEDGFYLCETDGSAEPSGTYPKACPPLD